jgi:hypothetical protein
MNEYEDFTEYILKDQSPWYKRRWWVRVKNTNVKYKTTVYGTEISLGKETYIPWWGWLFELVHRLFFGDNSKIKPKE